MKNIMMIPAYIHILTMSLCLTLVYSQSPAVHPILVIGSNTGFGTYTGEILKAEGFNAYQIESLEGITGGYLDGFDMVILTETELTSEQTTMFDGYVSNGGALIAFRPDKQLAPVFGLTDAGETIDEGYMLIDTAGVTGRGLTGETIQYHGAADNYDLDGATQIAVLYTDESTAAGRPAVVINGHGDGLTAAFTFNLPKSVVYMRQGNPEWAGQERDGITGLRAADMFCGMNEGPHWNNPAKIHISQADESMRILSHILQEFSPKPLPRFWYFPDSLKCLSIYTNDGELSSSSDFDTHFQDIQAKGANMSLYLIGTYIDAADVSRWAADGNEIGTHVNDTHEAASPTFGSMDSVTSMAVQDHLAAYGIQPRSVRNHWIVWAGWSTQAEIELSHGIRMDCNFYHYDSGSTYGNFLGDVGNFTGSGLPMRFAGWEGQVLNIYQSVTQLPDEKWGPQAIDDKFKILVDRSLDEENYTVINMNFHTQNWASFRAPSLAMLDYANSRGVPVWTAEHLLDFLDMRDSAGFKSMTWTNNQLAFQLEAPKIGEGLTLMFPNVYRGGPLQAIEKDGEPQEYIVRSIKGREYALVTTASGGTFDFTADYSQQTSTFSHQKRSMENLSDNDWDKVIIRDLQGNVIRQSFNVREYDIWNGPEFNGKMMKSGIYVIQFLGRKSKNSEGNNSQHLSYLKIYK
jgi:hypothetical protein